MRRIIKEYWQFAVAILAITLTILVMCCSCGSVVDVQRVYHHDTVYRNSVVHDSVDRWHTHYEYVEGDTVRTVDTFWCDRWHVRTDTAYKTVVDVQTKEVEKIVEKKVWVWWPLWAAAGLIIVAVLVIALVETVLRRGTRNSGSD